METTTINPPFDLDPFSPERLKSHIEDLKKASTNVQNKDLFSLKTASEWVAESKGKPIPKMLFGEFWFEGELCILFADTNQGKSTLAVQIADSISKGQAIPGFKLEAIKQTVLYFDFERSAKQFEAPYSKKNECEGVFEEHYLWDDAFFRVEMNPRADIPTNVDIDEYISASIEAAIEKTKTKVVIIDNLTYLKSDTEKSKDAAPFIKNLQQLIDKHDCSILVLAHTPKRDLSKPITRNDLQGSKRLIDFCDSAFAIGECHQDKGVKYLKQIKVRAMEFMYDKDNVIVCQLHKPFNFLMFEFLRFGLEREHLKEYTENDKEERIALMLELKNQGKTNVEIARNLGVSEGAIRKWIKKAGDKTI
jgi:RecA-family ATPase